MTKFTILLLTLACLFTQSDKRQTRRGDKPVVEKIEATPSSLTFCPVSVARVYCDTAKRTTVTLFVTASDPDGGVLKYGYVASTGEILGEGNQVTWNLKGQKFGTHEVKITVTDSDGDTVTSTLKVQIGSCRVCAVPDPPCPVVIVKSRAEVAHRAEKIIFSTEISPEHFRSRPDYLWTVKAGNILSGQHTPQIEVEVTGEISSEVTAVVEVDGFDTACTRSGYASVRIQP